MASEPAPSHSTSPLLPAPTAALAKADAADVLRLGVFTEGDLSRLAIFAVVQKKLGLTNHKNPKRLLSNALSSFPCSGCARFSTCFSAFPLRFHTPFIYFKHSTEAWTTQSIKWGKCFHWNIFPQRPPGTQKGPEEETKPLVNRLLPTKHTLHSMTSFCWSFF